MKVSLAYGFWCDEVDAEAVSAFEADGLAALHDANGGILFSHSDSVEEMDTEVESWLYVASLQFGATEDIQSLLVEVRERMILKYPKLGFPDIAWWLVAHT